MRKKASGKERHNKGPSRYAKRLFEATPEVRASIFVAMFIVPLACLLVTAVIVTSAATMVDDIRDYERIFGYYMDEVDANLNDISVYLANTASRNENVSNLIYDIDSRHYALNIRRLYLQIRQEISYYPQVQYLFVGTDKPATVISSPHINERGALSYSKVKPYVLATLAGGNYRTNEWELRQIDDEQYLMQIIEYNGVYIGACVDTAAVLRQVNRYVSPAAGTGRPGNIIIDPAAVSFKPQPGGGRLELALPFHVVLRSPSKTGNFHTAFTLDLTAPMLRLVLLLGFSCALLLLIPLSKRFLQRQFLQPIQVLTNHMSRIRGGDVHLLLPQQLGGPEMSVLAQTFNQMMTEITELNQRISDERLAERNLEMQVLNMQLDPHFFLNTLNSVFLLSRNGSPAELQQIIKNFSNYYRSVFQASESCLRLSEELDRCRDYVNIYKIRLYKDFSASMDVPEALLGCMVPQMCVQTFIENSLKYAMEDINGLKIEVNAHARQAEDGPYLEITVRDNGCGFPQEILEALRAQDGDAAGTSEHIGIRNLVARMRFLYAEQAFFRFENVPGGGAACTICLPLAGNSAHPKEDAV